MDLSRLVQLVWIGGLAATPIVIGVSLLCRSQKLRPATRHALWAAALASFLTPLAVAAVWRNTWFASDRVLSLADRVLPAGTHEPKDTTRIEPGAHASGRVNAGVEAMGAPARAIAVMETPRALDVPAQLLAAGPQAPIAIPTVETTPSRSTPVELMNECGIEPKPVARSVSQDGVEHGALAGPARRHGSEERPAATKPQPIGLNDQSAARTSDAGEKALIAGSVSRSTRVVLEKLVAVRDAIADLPPVPIYVWIGIAALLVLLRMFRSVTLRRIVNRARPAPRRMRELVSDMAGVMGLATPPETLTTESRISPMVWCGVRPKLVIPEDLWASLDDDSRRAVIAHELAHLKRRDHLLHWIAALVAAAYWWHPAAWWARRKMNEEAEASCDAWVTSLFPRRRRAYAEALLVTSSFLGSPAYHAGPALGVVDGRTKLARRITMVMTQRTAPNASKIGVIVASLVLATGALVTPGLACPPEKEAKAPKPTEAGGAFLGEAPAIDALIQAEKAQAEKAAKSKNKAKRKVPGQTTIAVPEGSAAASDVVKIYGGQVVSPDAMARAYVVDRAQIERAQEELAKVYTDSATQNQARAAQNQARAAANQARAAERAAKAYSDAVRRANRSNTVAGLATPAAPAAPVAPLAPMTPMPAMPPSPPAAMSPFSGQAPMATQPSFDAFGGTATISGPAEGTEPREYRLPNGKLQALSDLMARQDVPIWIERGQGKIVVHATPEQHEVFAAFVKMINPDGSTGAGASIGGSSPALARPLLGQTRAATRVTLDQLRAHLEALESQRDHREEHLDSLRQRAEEMREKAESLREMADELREKAQESSNEAARDALRQAEQALSAESSGLETQATDIEAQAAAVESEFESMESAIASLESQIESIEESDLAALTTDVAPSMIESAVIHRALPVEIVAPTLEIADADDVDDVDTDDEEDSDDELVIPSDILEPAPEPTPTSPATPASL